MINFSRNLFLIFVEENIEMNVSLRRVIQKSRSTSGKVNGC